MTGWNLKNSGKTNGIFSLKNSGKRKGNKKSNSFRKFGSMEEKLIVKSINSSIFN